VSETDLFGRAERWAWRNPARLARVSTTVLLVRIARGFSEARVMGLAAEMTYYAILSLFPLIAALGASLGFLEGLVGPVRVAEFEVAVVASMEAVFSADATRDVITPMVQGLLREERGGFAIGSFLVTLFLASRVFRSAIETLDLAYRVEEGRSLPVVWALGLVFALGAIVSATAMLAVIVLGPFLGLSRLVLDPAGGGAVIQLLWAIVRWAVVFGIGTGSLAVLYRFGPNVLNGWRDTLPGALFGASMLVIVSTGFRLYLELGGLASPEITDADAAVAIGAHVFGTVLAALLWLWLSTMVVLTGGVLNAELSRLTSGAPEPRTAPD
jgi:membrane protein